jgi:hypothetical protein
MSDRKYDENDSFDFEYELEKRRLLQEERTSLLLDANAEASPALEEETAEAAARPAPAEEEEESGWLGDVLTQLGWGGVEAVGNTGDALGMSVDPRVGAGPGARGMAMYRAANPDTSIELPLEPLPEDDRPFKERAELPEPKTTAGAFGRTFGQVLPFLAPGIGWTRSIGLAGRVPAVLPRLTRVAPKLTKALGIAVEGAAIGAPIDYLAFSPTDDNLSNMLQTLGVDSSFVDSLAHEADDTEFEGRLKNLIEGSAIGAGLDLALPVVGRLGMRLIRTARASRGRKAVTEAAIQSKSGPADVISHLDRQVDEVTALRESVDGLRDVADEMGDRAPRQLKEDLQVAEEQLQIATDNLTGSFDDVSRRGEVDGRVLESYRQVLDGSAPDSVRATDEAVNEALGASASASQRVATTAPKAAGRSFTARGLRIDETEAQAVLDAMNAGDFEGAAEAFSTIWDSTNYNRIADEDGIKDVLAGIAEMFGGRDDSARLLDVRSLDETERLARQKLEIDGADFGNNVDGMEQALGKMMPDVANLDVKVNAIRFLELSLAKRFKQLATTVNQTGGTALEQAEFVRTTTLMAHVNDIRAGIVSEIGRALSSLRIQATGDFSFESLLDNPQLREEAAALVNGAGGAEKIQALAAKAVMAGDDLSATRGLMAGFREKKGIVWSMFQENYFASILSNPTTQVVNAAGNATTGLAWLPAEGLLYDAMGAIRHGDLEYFKPFIHQVRGLIHGHRVALIGTAKANRLSLREGTMAKAFRTGDTVTVPSRISMVEGHSRDAITSENMARLLGDNPVGRWMGNKSSIGARLVDTFGTANRWPFRMLATLDELAKSVNYYGAINRAAWEDGLAQGLRGKELDNYANALAKDSTRIDQLSRVGMEKGRIKHLRNLDEQARNFAKNATFTDDLSEGTIGKWLKDGANRHPSLRLIVPFIQTPANLLRFSLVDRGPLGLFSKRFSEEMAAGGVTRQKAIARMTLGNAAFFGAFSLAADGRLTGGGPTNPSQRETLLATGWKPYSIIFKNDDGSLEYVSFARMDPIANFLAVSADIVEKYGEMDDPQLADTVAMTTAALIENMKSKSYMQGLADFFEAVQDSSNWPRFLGRMGASLAIPQTNLLAQINRANFNDTVVELDRRSAGTTVTSYVAGRLPPGFDDAMRHVGNALTELEVRDTEPKLNMFGEEVRYPLGMGSRNASPFYSNTREPDVVKDEMARLQLGTSMRSSYGSIRAGDTNIKLSPAQTNAYIRATANPRHGPSLHEHLKTIIESEEYQTAGDPVGENRGGKAEILEGEIRKFRKRGQEVMLRNDKELQGRVIEGRTNAKKARSAEGSKELQATTDALGIKR